MSEEEKKNVTEEPQHVPTNKEKFNSYMSERIEGYNPEDEEGMYGQLYDRATRRDDESKKMTDLILADPRLASVLSDIAKGKRGAAGALARYFGKDMLSAEEGTPEYDEIMAAEEERKKDAEAASENQRKYDENLEKSVPVIDEFCQANGLEKDNFLNDVWEKVVSPIMQGIYTKEMCELLYKGFSYDTDVADAQAAGEVKGRNTNINKMRSDKKGDGMPTGLSSEQLPQTRKPRRKSMLELASEA